MWPVCSPIPTLAQMKPLDAPSCHFQCSLGLGTGGTHKLKLEFKESFNDVAVNNIYFSLNVHVASSGFGIKRTGVQH